MSEKPRRRPIAEAIRRHLKSKRLPDDAVIILQVPIDNERKAAPENSVPAPNVTPCSKLSKVSHSEDFASVLWIDGKNYPFTLKQRPVIAMLWHAMMEGTHFVSSGALLEAAEVNAERLRDLFRGSKAWGKVIVQGMLHGGPIDTYRIAPLDAEGGAQ